MQALSLFSFIIGNIPLLLLAIIGISFLIVFHEFGHLIFAKIFNVYAPSFSVGFGPRVLQKKIGETTYALSAIPLGGYVELAGAVEGAESETPHEERVPLERTFNAKPYWQKLLIMFGGILFNLIFAYAALSLLHMIGAPCIGSTCDNEPAAIEVVRPDTAAAKAELLPHDIIVGVNEKETPSIKAVVDELKANLGKTVTLDIKRGTETKKIEVSPATEGEGDQARPVLGVIWHIEKKGFIESLKEGFATTNSLIAKTFEAFTNITKDRGKSIGGPLALIHQVTQFAGLGFRAFLFILSFISINLAVFNLLPLPIFDGGQILFFTIEAITQKPLSEKTRESIHYYTWLMFIVLVILLTGKDILKLFGK